MRVQATTLAACLLLAGCATVAAPSDDLHASIRRCGLEGQIQVEPAGAGRLNIRYLNRNADHANVECFLAETRRLGLVVGFTNSMGPPIG